MLGGGPYLARSLFLYRSIFVLFPPRALFAPGKFPLVVFLPVLLFLLLRVYVSRYIRGRLRDVQWRVFSSCVYIFCFLFCLHFVFVVFSSSMTACLLYYFPDVARREFPRAYVAFRFSFRNTLCVFVMCGLRRWYHDPWIVHLSRCLLALRVWLGRLFLFSPRQWRYVCGRQSFSVANVACGFSRVFPSFVLSYCTLRVLLVNLCLFVLVWFLNSSRRVSHVDFSVRLLFMSSSCSVIFVAALGGYSHMCLFLAWWGLPVRARPCIVALF